MCWCFKNKVLFLNSVRNNIILYTISFCNFIFNHEFHKINGLTVLRVISIMTSNLNPKTNTLNGLKLELTLFIFKPVTYYTLTAFLAYHNCTWYPNLCHPCCFPSCSSPQSWCFLLHGCGIQGLLLPLHQIIWNAEMHVTASGWCWTIWTTTTI